VVTQRQCTKRCAPSWFSEVHHEHHPTVLMADLSLLAGGKRYRGNGRRALETAKQIISLAPFPSPLSSTQHSHTLLLRSRNPLAKLAKMADAPDDLPAGPIYLIRRESFLNFVPVRCSSRGFMAGKQKQTLRHGRPSRKSLKSRTVLKTTSAPQHGTL
jgi:hypothetical protein